MKKWLSRIDILVTMKNLGSPSVRRAIAAPCLLLAGLFCAVLVRSQSGAPRGTWSTKAPLPTKRFEVGSVTLGNKIYVIAGESNGEPAKNLITEYDPATNRWRELAPIPHVTSHPGVAAGNGKIYVLGGFTGVPHVGAVDIAFEYDVATDKWRAHGRLHGLGEAA